MAAESNVGYLERAAGKDVLLVERFDRELVDGSWHRRGVVSALTLLQLDEMMAAYASYQFLAEIIRHRFADPRGNLPELFARLVFNILVGNTDDHTRNHAAFWNGADFTLTPAYDICPQMRTGQGEFLLSKDDAHESARRQIKAINTNWHTVCDEASLGIAEREFMWERQFLNPFALQGFDLN